MVRLSGVDMANSVTGEAFWIALEQSGLLAPDQLESVKDALPSAEGASAEQIAQHLVQRRYLSRFQADRLLAGRARGFFFDHYKVIDLLGVGGMGWVYRAVDTKTGDDVALKVLRDDLKLDAGMLARFQQEARLGLQLDHPNIVKTLEVGSAGGLPYVIMPYLPGPNLLELLVQCKRLPWPQACELARQAALGLDYAHQQGVVHRDVKPQNVLISEQGEARLLDFGLSMLQEGDAGDEFSLAMIFGHESVGTSEYAAPEQVRDSLTADARSDIFSLGATLFAALTGVNPFPTNNKKANYQACTKSVRDYVPNIPPEVAEIVARMLDTDPKRRFRSGAEAAAALADWATSGPIEFDYAAILRERKRYAAQRLAQLSESSAAALGIARSTARPAAGMSAVAPPAARPRTLNGGETSLSPQLSGQVNRVPELIRGPAARWITENTPSPLANATLLLADSHVRIPLMQETVLAGRGEDADLRLIDGAVSSKHCQFEYDGRAWWINDLKSRNGTAVNGIAVKRKKLQPGDEILIASVIRFRWEQDDADVKQHRNRRSSPLSWFIWLAILAAALVTAAVAVWQLR